MDIKFKAIMAITIIVFCIFVYIISKNNRKENKEGIIMSDNLKDTTTPKPPFVEETSEQYYERCKTHIQSYLTENEYQFYTSNSTPAFLVPFEASDSLFEIHITPHYYENIRVINFTAKITSGPLQDAMLAAIAELTNRMNSVSINSQIYLDFESREVEICKSLVVSYFDIDFRMFDWYFRCVLNAGTARKYLNRVLFENESPALVALDFSHA